MCIVVTRGEVTRGEVVEAALAYFNSHADMDSSGLQATVQELGGGMRKSQAGVVYGDERFKRLMATVGARIGELDSGSLVEMASALSALPGPSTPEVSEVCRKITEIMVKRRDEFKPAGLARIALALACRGSRDPTLIEMVKEDTLSQIEEFSPSELCCILEAHRRWGVHDRELTENVVERLTDEVDRFTAEDLVKTLEVFASLGLARRSERVSENAQTGQ
ncbi:hypothetical protein Pmar_PMAR016242 [Perkinsus marinus ATCC 50983]|uniref:RNA-editing substrate-binding complex 6 protein domain-containing protein n=1 Tax=Perkinsus marinus (strain ATCC 50983 / TXsc) TaxID=423536 RepID=C5KIY1_PERM5|nr:hypothetical protein Pmar_PMAR016242 [Perkinsus marinus ATCC 50983]EER15557.1 hypothetical protein Pmar_PMAR016242 [Perkinsus marinus ATCC 50983]|eukprot:XP_002783761.1 hypothetical protein Pmar_PMAR016242 [Perkinsus marinus ATCC 50983]